MKSTTRRLLAALAFAGLLAGCSRAAAPPSPMPLAASPSPRVPNIASVTAHGTAKNPIVFQNIVNSHPVYSLKASSVTYLPNRQEGTFSDNHLVFYKGTAERLTVTAPSAVLNLKTYDVVLRGGVKADNANGDQLSADQIAYDGKAHQLVATGNVVAVDAAGTKITGDRAVADLDLQQIKIFGHISMTGNGK